ncbi:hypothetical protein ACP70R_035693 [Stipagrostis hirtigluma subsp. patula]
MTSKSSDQAIMESGGGPPSEVPGASAKKLWRMMRAVYLVLVKGLGKHQRKLAAVGVHLHHLHHLLSSKRDHRAGGLAAARGHPALTYLSSLSCRSMDPAAAVVHPYPRGAGAHGHRRASSSAPTPAGSLFSLSCRSMDPAAAACQYQYRSREVQFSFKSTPLHKRRRHQKRRLRLQNHGADVDRRDHSSAPPEYYGSATAVTRLFELMDAEEAAKAAGVDDDDDGDLESAVAWPALAMGPAPRQVRITDSPFLARVEDDEDGRGVVDRRADEFIKWFHEQLRTQQQR